MIIFVRIPDSCSFIFIVECGDNVSSLISMSSLLRAFGKTYSGLHPLKHPFFNVTTDKQILLALICCCHSGYDNAEI